MSKPVSSAKWEFLFNERDFDLIRSGYLIIRSKLFARLVRYFELLAPIRDVIKQLLLLLAILLPGRYPTAGCQRGASGASGAALLRI